MGRRDGVALRWGRDQRLAGHFGFERSIGLALDGECGLGMAQRLALDAASSEVLWMQMR